MNNEIWKPIPGLEQYYEVSNLGRVKVLARDLEVFWRNRTKKVTYKEHFLKPSKDACRISSCKNRKIYAKTKSLESTSTCMVSFSS